MVNELYILLRYFHFIFIAWGVGGATIAYMLMKKSEKDPKLAPASMEMTKSISKLIWVALIGAIISGIGFSFVGFRTVAREIFMIKIIFVTIIIINGLYLGLRLVPKLSRLAPKPNVEPSKEFIKTKKYMKIGGLISLFCWYIVIFLAVLMLYS